VANGSARILLVDDEQSIQTLLSYPLRKDGYHVTSALDGGEALQRFEEGRFDLVILDLMLPRLDGVEVCRELRSRSQVPIIMLTAKGSETDKVAGLEVGADDYITKPFSMREFRSRVKAALRRSRMGAETTDEERIESGELTVDFGRRMVTLREEEVRVTYVEFEILGALARSPGRVLTRETLLEHVWATPSTATHAPSTSTSGTCGRSWSRTPRSRSSSSPCVASVIAFASRCAGARS